MSAAFVGAHLCADAVNAFLGDSDFATFANTTGDAALVRDSNLLAHTSLLMGSNPLLAKIVGAEPCRRPATFAKFAAINSREIRSQACGREMCWRWRSGFEAVGY